MKDWLETNEIKEVISSFELLVDRLPKVLIDEHNWKWVIISLHNGLQGLMVLALQSSNHLNVLKDKSAEKWLKAYESKKREFPEVELDTFLYLYKKIKSERMKKYTNSIQFTPSDSQDKSIRKLNLYRNDFIHFVPKAWSIELAGLPSIIHDCIDISEFLVFESNNIDPHDKKFKIHIKKYIELSKKSLLDITEKHKTP